MLFSRKLITKFIPDFVNITDDKLTQTVNALGMEIESIKKYQPVNNVVVGQIVSFVPVEGTHLNKCEVKVNQAQTNTIVCGASHLQQGAKVLVALEGAKLPNGITIQKRMIRGMESNGMICAYSELTNDGSCVADAEQDEIIMLEDGIVGSSNWQSLIGLDDTIYDVTVPANRNDENSYLVFCYEIANKLGLKLNTNIKDIVKSLPLSSNKIAVDSTACSFLSFMDYDVKPDYIKRSTWELKSILMNHGIKPINQMLDKLSFITLLTNCPTHVYDADKLQGTMSCKLSTNEMKFVALNGKSYTLAPKDVLIYDGSHAVSIAAIIGSENTKLTNKTSKARIEIGNFNFAQVRTTSIRINCDTDASRKASRPLSNYLNFITIELIKKYFGLPTSMSIWYKTNWNTKKISLDYQKLSWFINEPLNKSYIVSSLKKLGYENGFFLPSRFRVPAWRLDVANQEDLYEDILKIIDVNRLKPISISDKLLPITNNTDYKLKQGVKDILLSNYFNEVKTYNLTNKTNLGKFNLFNLNNAIKILANNSNREYFRVSLLDGMLKTYKYNDARKLDLIPIFELQRIFTNDSKMLNLSCISLDKYKIDAITNSTIETNLNYYKAIVEQIAQLLNTKVEFKIEAIKEFYNNESISIIFDNKIVGYIGKIKSGALKDYDLNNKQIYALSMNLSPLLDKYEKARFSVKEFGVFQRLSKDINIILDNENVHLINKKVDEIKKNKDVADAKIINIFNKDNKTVYTVRYYLVDTRQFTANDLEIITKQIESLSSL